MNAHGPRLNRECSNCVYPCQGGEKLHPKRLDYACCHGYCPCLMFEPVSASSLLGFLNRGLQGRKTRAMEIRL